MIAQDTRGTPAASIALGTPSTSTTSSAGRAAPALVFDRVTVVDVEAGRLRPDQRVVIVGNRIQAVGRRATVKLPPGAQVVEARGQYLIPGLWDLHAHVDVANYPFSLAMGVTGVRIPGGGPLDSVLQWRREILAGRRVGPPRQSVGGIPLHGGVMESPPCDPKTANCINDPARAQRVVDSLQAAGADMLKMYDLSGPMYFAIAAAARRRSILFGGHVENVSAIAASDSGARIIDHLRPPLAFEPGNAEKSGGLAALCYRDQATVATCRPVAERFRRQDTWVVPTVAIALGMQPVAWRARVRYFDYFKRLVTQDPKSLWRSSLFRGQGNWLRDSTNAGNTARGPDSLAKADAGAWREGFLSVIERSGLPIAAGTDHAGPSGWWLHVELATYVAEGISPLHALQSATLNPAKLFHATDSLGTVAPGKLADLVLLAGNPLADITNTTTIRAVVANGRYFDRTALNGMLDETLGKPPR